MSIIKSHRLDQDFTISLGAPWVVPPSIVPRVDEIWEFEKARRGIHLTNGQVYTLAEFRPDYILVHPSEYKYVLAQRRSSNLQREELGVQPLGVTGILVCADGVVLGRRGSGVTDDVGLWEPAPAGGLSIPDPRVQVLEELEEELGMAKSEVDLIKVCGLVEDVDSRVFDIIFRLETAATAEEVRAAFTSNGSDEFSDLAIVEFMKIPAFLDAHRNDLLPALWTMLRLASVV